jgi:YidC/Oxa1 family membrane protein insertase
MKIAFFPLTRKQIIAAKRMQELKPKLETLQKVYKDNPQKLQQEMMELYKKYNVNPFSGCLTLIIQMPIFFALYQILTNSISLKGAPFILWIKDLSEKDPYYILPILMGVTSIILSSIQQAATDPQSKMLMYMMPILFVIIFISLPSGIVLYWLTFNILGILEALLIKRLEGRHGT